MPGIDDYDLRSNGLVLEIPRVKGYSDGTILTM